jgi:hypothetical protein
MTHCPFLGFSPACQSNSLYTLDHAVIINFLSQRFGALTKISGAGIVHRFEPLSSVNQSENYGKSLQMAALRSIGHIAVRAMVPEIGTQLS